MRFLLSILVIFFFLGVLFFPLVQCGNNNDGPGVLADIPKPAANPSGGVYGQPQKVTLTTGTPSAKIRYTLDGTDPSPTVGTEYLGGEIEISLDTYLKAVTYVEGKSVSQVLSEHYIFRVFTPRFLPEPGTFASSIEVELKCDTPNAEIRYTIDGSNPGEGVGLVFATGTPIVVSENTTIKAQAFVVDLEQSEIATGEYTIKEDSSNWDKYIDVSGNYSKDLCYDIAIDSADNVYVVGSAVVNPESQEDWVIKKFHPEGAEYTADEGWEKVLSLGVFEDEALAVGVDELNEKVYVGGYYTYLDDKNNKKQTWTIKRFDANDGSLESWKADGIEINGQIFGELSNIAMYETADDRIAIFVSGYSKEGLDSDPMGVIRQFYHNASYKAVWNINYDFYSNIYDMVLTSANAIYIIGSGFNLISSDSENLSGEDVFIKKYNVIDTVYGDEGSEISEADGWEKTFDAGGFKDDRLNSLAVDSSQNVYAAGFSKQFLEIGSQKDWWIKKFSEDGDEDLSWPTKFNDTNSLEDEEITKLMIDGEDNLFVIGYGFNLINDLSHKDWRIRKFDAAGVEDTEGWNLIIDNPTNTGEDYDKPVDAAFDSIGNLFVIGISKDLSERNQSDYDWWVKKFNK